MPHIEHVAYWVEDLDRVSAFYSEQFGAEIGPLYVNAAKGYASRFLRFDSGTRIELMSSSGVTRQRREAGIEPFGLAHIAISLGSVEAVDELTQKLEAAGVTVLGAPRRTGDGYYESVVQDPEGNRIELTV